MKKKQIIITLLILAVTLIILTPNSNAALQSNGSTPTTQSLTSWMSNIRKMEGVGGALGLTETMNASTLLSTSGSNNLDIHMEKNTEYGAIAILSASSYGNPNKIENGGTTTGNETGIVMNLNKEWVAAGYLTSVAEFTNANSRYKNVYEVTETTINSSPYSELKPSGNGKKVSNYTRKIGDAITETNGWHGSTSWVWLSGWGSSRESGLIRAYSGSIFSYYGYNGFDKEDKLAQYTKTWASRAIMVCGEGI